MSSELGKKATAGAVWASIDRVSYMGLQFVVNIILANLLLPEDYGAIGLLAIFMLVSQALVDGGFSSALIQKKEPTQDDYSTIFFWNLGFSTFLYLILFAGAPLIGAYYRNAELASVLRVVGVSIIVMSMVSVQQTRLRKSLAFKSLAIVNLASYGLSAVVAVAMAYEGFGVWALVAQQILTGVFSLMMLRVITRWGPSLIFSMDCLKRLFSFGGFILAANVLQVACQNLQGLIIGRKFSDVQMGYYSQAYKLDQVTSYAMPQVIVQVMYPVYAQIQNERERLIEMVVMNVRVISLAVFPILTCLILIAEPLFNLLYGAKWLPAVPYFQVLCVGGLFVCLQNVNFYAVAAVGRSRALFKISLYKWTFLIAALLIGMHFGMFGLLWGMVLSSINIFVVNALLAQKFVGVPLVRELRVMGGVLAVAVVSLAVGVTLKHYLGIHVLLSLAAQVATYVLLAKLLLPAAVADFFNLAKRLFRR